MSTIISKVRGQPEKPGGSVNWVSVKLADLAKFWLAEAI
jgi:hypothetical protein